MVGAWSNSTTLANVPKYFILIKGPLQLILMDQNVRVWFDQKFPPGFLAQNIKNDVVWYLVSLQDERKKYQKTLRKGTFKIYELQKQSHKEATNRASSPSGINYCKAAEDGSAMTIYTNCWPHLTCSLWDHLMILSYAPQKECIWHLYLPFITSNQNHTICTNTQGRSSLLHRKVTLKKYIYYYLLVLLFLI